MYESQPHFFGNFCSPGGVPRRDTHKWKQVRMIAKKKEEKGHIVLEQVDLIYIVVMCVVAMCANTTKDLFFSFRNAA